METGQISTRVWVNNDQMIFLVNYSFNLQLRIIQTCCYHPDSQWQHSDEDGLTDSTWFTVDSTLQKNKWHAEKTLKRQSQEWTLISNSLWKSAEWPLESWRTSAEDNDSIQSAEKTLGMPQIHNIMSSEPITRSRVRALHFLTATYRNRSLRKVQKDASSCRLK